MSRTEEYALARLGSALAGPDLAEALATELRKQADHAMVRALVEDRRCPVSLPAAPLVQAPASEGVISGGDGAAHTPTPQRGWTNCPTVDGWRPSGIAIIDGLVDQRDALDKAERAAELAKLKSGGKP